MDTLDVYMCKNDRNILETTCNWMNFQIRANFEIPAIFEIRAIFEIPTILDSNEFIFMKKTLNLNKIFSFNYSISRNTRQGLRWLGPKLQLWLKK